MMEECGEMEAGEARRWKEGIYGLMLLWGLEPDEVLADVPITWSHTKPDARAANV